MSWIHVEGTGRVEYGKYKPVDQTRSGRNTKRPQWLTQQRVEEGDRIRKLSPKERLKLLKETLKKSTTLTEKLLRRLDKKWDNIYKEDSEDDEENIKATPNFSGKTSEADRNHNFKSLDSIEKLLKVKTEVQCSEDEETSDSDSDDNYQTKSEMKKRKKPFLNGDNKRPRIDYEDEDSDSDVPPELPRQTKSGRLTQKPKLFVPEDKKKKKGKKLKTDDELIEEISFVREDQRSPEEIINDENQTDPPYRADYSVTDRSICKICANNIGEGELRFRCNKGYSHSTYTHHAKCFILQYRPKSIKEIDNYDLLSSEDQQHVRQMLQNALVGEKSAQNGQKPPQKIKIEPQSDEESNEEFSLSGAIRAMNVARSLEIGHSHSNFPYRVSYGDDGLLLTVCKMCTKNIEKGDFRLRITERTFTLESIAGAKLSGLWHHGKCFFLQYQPKNVGEIGQYNLLSLKDQRIVNEMLQTALDKESSEEDESADEELKKELKDEVKSQKNGKKSQGSIKTEDFKPLLTREGRKWNGKAIPVEQPLLISGGIMKGYQIEGLIWMANLRKVGANGILADEMGLGKTLQTISLFCQVSEVNKNAGPFLVIAPLSTLLNWKREVERFAPGVPVKVLYPKKDAVEEWDYLEDRHPSPLGGGRTLGTIYITSYETSISIRSMLQEVEWDYIVVDEGHRLKNKDCQLVIQLKRIKSKHRMLLTGTPLQNDMEELFALLSYLQPDLFTHHEMFSDYYDARKLHKQGNDTVNEIVDQESKNSILAQIHKIIGPFILRRKKSEVDLSILPKKEVHVYCPMTLAQRQQYQTFVSVLKGDKKWAKGRQCLGGAQGAFQMSYMMDLRHACNHPYIRGKRPDSGDPDQEFSQDIIDVCGKMQVLHQMLKRLSNEGHKTLIFSQFTTVLDLIGASLELKGYKYCQLDGRVKLEQRQIDVERFFKEPDLKVFLLSTRAGGLGINLTAADTCIIYDSDWNPQQDLQAQDRCHRIGQNRPVVIFRLVAKNTIDESIVQRAQAKRSIEKLVVHQDKFKSGHSSLKETTEKVLSAKDIMAILLSKDDMNTTEEASDDQYGLSENILDELMDRSGIVKEWLATGGILPEDSDFDINGDEIKKEVKQEVKQEDIKKGDLKLKVDDEDVLESTEFEPKLHLDKSIADHQYIKSDDSAEDDNEKEADETELERILKKNEYYKKLKEDREFKAKQLPITEANKKKSEKKSQMKKNDDETEDDGFGHKVKLLDIADEDTDDSDGNPKSEDDEKNPYEKFYQRKSNGGVKKGSLPNDKQFPCDLCEKATCYSTEKALETHKRTAHGISSTGKSPAEKENSATNLNFDQPI